MQKIFVGYTQTLYMPLPHRSHWPEFSHMAEFLSQLGNVIWLYAQEDTEMGFGECSVCQAHPFKKKKEREKGKK